LRDALRRKQKVVKGDTTIVNSYQEWLRLKELKDAEAELRAEVISKHGKEAWEMILEIKQRKQREALELSDEHKRDLQKLRNAKIASFAAAAMVVALLYLFGLM
jgi:hypothetical protein